MTAPRTPGIGACFLLIALVIAAAPLQLQAQGIRAIRPFVSDGCTAFSDGTYANPHQWRHCCFAHDLRFWAGGSEAARDRSDLRLRACVAATGATEIAGLMYRAVRLGKYSPVKSSDKRWGNAWSSKRSSYLPLTAAEIKAIQEAVATYDLPAAIRTHLLEDLQLELR